MFLSDLHKVIIVFFVLTFLPLEVWPAPFTPDFKNVEIQIRSEVRVSGDKVRLGDVATIYAKKVSDFHRLSEMEVLQFAPDSLSVSVPYDYLLSRIQESLGEGKEFRLTAAKEVKFVKEKRGISPTELVNEIWLQGKKQGKIPEGVEIEMIPIAGFEGLAKVPAEKFVVEAANSSSYWKNEIEFTIRAQGGSQAVLSKLKGNVRWFANVYVSNRKIRFLENLSKDVFRIERKDVTALSSELFPVNGEKISEDNLKSARAKKTIEENQPLLLSHIEKKADALPGQNLKVVFVSESGLKVSAEGLLLAPGILGESTRARLKASKKVVVGRLVSEGVMEVSL